MLFTWLFQKKKRPINGKYPNLSAIKRKLYILWQVYMRRKLLIFNSKYYHEFLHSKIVMDPAWLKKVKTYHFNTKSLYFSMNSGSVKIEYPNFFLLAFLGISSRLDSVEWILARAHFRSSSSSQSVKKGHVWRPFWRWVRGGIFFIFGLEVTYVQYFEEMKWKKSALFFLQRYEPISFGHFSL